MAYTYNAENAAEYGVDRMRFELGDVQVAGGAATCALTDEEYAAVLSGYSSFSDISWKRAKLKLVKAILARFAYEVDTQVDHLSLSLSDRYNSPAVKCQEGN